MSTKKSAVKNTKAPKPEEPQPQKTPTEAQPEPEAPEPQPEPETPPESVTSTTESKPATIPAPALTLKYLHQELESLRQLVGQHATLLAQLQETLARKRKPPASNGKVQIKDKLTGKIYKSKNNTYQSLLKSGELKELVDQGVFGDIPEKNTFGWYVLNRAWPGRFEEVHEQEQTA